MTTDGETGTQTATRRQIRVTISKDRLSATIAAQKPDPGDPEITVDDVMAALKKAGVVHGVDNDAIAKIVADKVYDSPTKIARGDQPQKGEDTKFEYCFETDIRGTPKEGKDGRIDYYNISSIQNVEKGAVLARRTLPTPGTNGKGVDGKEIVASRGRDLPIRSGANTSVSPDGLELTSTVDGAIVIRNGTISVKDVLVIDGDVDFSVGNIDCVGSVKVRGDVHAGFELKVGGNLEIDGNLQDCNVCCKGNLLVKGGCFGTGEGSIHADGDVFVKYAQGQKISSGNEITVMGELLNCHVTAKERVRVKGKKGKIVGGEINAGREIRAPILGSEAGTPTILTVAFDSELMQKFQNTAFEMERLERDMARVKERLMELYKLQMDGELSQARKTVMTELELFQRGVPEALKDLEKKKKDIEGQLREFKDVAIIAEDTIYTGVEARFGTIHHQLNETRRRCRLSFENDQVLFSEYKPS